MKNIYATIWLAGCFSIVAACAPITPLPGGMPTSLPSPPSSGGAPSMPSGTPPSLPGGSPSLPGGQPGGQPSGQSGSESGSESGEQPSSEGSEGLPGGNMPGGQPGGMPGGSDPNSPSDGEAPEPTWDVEQGGSSGAEGEGQSGGQAGAGGSDSGDDGWDTSNEIPGTPGSADAQGTDGQTDASADGGPAGTPSGDDELEGALKDFDGEILAEREIIGTSTSSSGNGAGGALELPTGPDSDGGNSDDVATNGGPLPPRRQIPTAPAPPPRGSESVPDNLPDARDDDIIARQLREAAMQEADPELQEKLWEEYRKYKKG